MRNASLFPEHLMSPSLAVKRYEALSKRPRSSTAWHKLASRLHLAAAWAKHDNRDPDLSEILVELACVCRRRACEPLALAMAVYRGAK